MQTFGVELETNVPRYSCLDMPAGWTARGDASVHANSGMNAREFVSPVLSGVDGIASVRAACVALVNGGAKVNTSCGLHVHIGASDMTSENVAMLQQFARVYEFALFGVCGAKIEKRMTSRHAKQYCKPSQYWNNGYTSDRYKSLNTVNWLRNQGRSISDQHKNTVEFRCFAGTVEPLEVLGAVALARCFAAVAKKGVDGKWENMPTVDTKRITDPLDAMKEVIALYFNPGSVNSSGVLLHSDVKNYLLAQAKAAKKKLLTL